MLKVVLERESQLCGSAGRWVCLKVPGTSHHSSNQCMFALVMWVLVSHDCLEDERGNDF